MTTEEMTQDEVQHFATKLNAFGQSLSAKEQLLLAAILRRAASAETDDVEGFDMNMQPEAPHQWTNTYAGTGGHAMSGNEIYSPPPQVHTTTCDFTSMIAPALGYPGNCG